MSEPTHDPGDIVRRAARSFLHGDDWDQADLAKLAEALGEDVEDVAALPNWHNARPGADDQHCGVCGQEIQKMPDGVGSIYLHVDSGSVAAFNPPRRNQT